MWASLNLEKITSTLVTLPPSLLSYPSVSDHLSYLSFCHGTFVVGGTMCYLCFEPIPAGASLEQTRVVLTSNTKSKSCMFHAILVLVFFCNYLLLLMFHLDWWHMAERWASRCNTQETCQMKSDVWQGTDPNDVSTWEQVRCVAVWIFWGASKMLCCFKKFGEDCMNWKQK